MGAAPARNVSAAMIAPTRAATSAIALAPRTGGFSKDRNLCQIRKILAFPFEPGRLENGFQVASGESTVIWLMQQARKRVDQSVEGGKIAVLDGIGQDKEPARLQHTRNFLRDLRANFRR